MVAWGTISTCTAAVDSSSGLYAVRFLLGVVESAYYPGSLFLISSFYKRSELGLRSSILYAGAQIGSAFSGLIAAGITQGLDGALGLKAWRWIFLIEGSITVFVAILAFFILPDWPSTTKWLTPAERAVAEWRLIKDAGQVDEDHGSWEAGFKAAFSDWRLYVFAVMFMCNMVATSTQNFFPSVVATLGYGRITTLLLSAPPYLVGALISIANNWSADRRANASFHIIWPLALATVGFVTGAATLNKGARYFAMYLMIAGGHGANAVIVSWCQKTLLRPRIKRAAAVAFVNCFGNIAQVYAAYFYPNSDAPRYAMAMALNSAFAVAGILLAVSMRLVLLRANQKIAMGGDVAQVMRGTAEQEIQGLSDEERLARKQDFRYVA